MCVCVFDTKNSCVSDFKECLFLQAYHGHAQALEVLLQGETEVDQRDEAGRTSLALAALRGHIECVHTLLSQGASPHTTDGQHGRTPVHLAGDFMSERSCKPIFKISYCTLKACTRINTKFGCWYNKRFPIFAIVVYDQHFLLLLNHTAYVVYLVFCGTF